MLSYQELISSKSFTNRSNDYIRWYPKTLTPVAQLITFDDRTIAQGIYIHVPFCDKICTFCPYNKRKTESDLLQQYLDALLLEIDIYSYLVNKSDVAFIYFGGGSPSVLSPESIARILSQIRKGFKVNLDVEITLEAHPTHLTREYVRGLKQVGISRISSGLQAFDSQLLERLGAQHSERDCENAIENVGCEFGNLAIDLLYRCPETTLPQWETQLNRALKYKNIDHISCYSLVLPDPSKQPTELEEVEMALMAHSLLSNHQFKHYASCASGGFDFCKSGARSKYEYYHWAAPQYQFIGLGPGALGFIGNSATANILSIQDYIQQCSRREIPLISKTDCSEVELMRRYFVLGTKTLQIPLDPFRKEFSQEPLDLFKKEFDDLQRLGLAKIDNQTVILTELGSFFVDTISAIFFSEFERSIPHPEEPELRALERDVRQKNAAAQETKQPTYNESKCL